MSVKLAETNDRLGNLVNVSSQKIIISNEILIALLEAARQEKNIILEKEIPKKDNYKLLIRESVAKIDRKIPELEELVDDQGKQTLREFKSIWVRYLQNLDELITLAYQNESEKAFAISGSKGFSVRNQSVILLNRLIEKNKNSLVEDKKASDASYSASINTIIVLIILSVLIAFFTAYNIIKIIAHRIKNIAITAQRIASREYLDEKTEIHINDELKPILISLDNINKSFREVSTNASLVASGDYSAQIVPKSDKDVLGNSLQKMTASLKHTTAENEKHIWLSSGLNQLSEQLRGDQEIEPLVSGMLSFLCRYMHASVGAVYLSEANNTLKLTAGYALAIPDTDTIIPYTEGLIGQAASEQKPIYIESESLLIRSSLVEHPLKHLIAVPFVFEGRTIGVIELGSLEPFTAIQKEFIATSLESISISIDSAQARRKIQLLLEETQVQSEELQSQQEELRQMNEELEEQTQSLKQQQEELQVTNEELEEQTQALELKNKELETTRLAIEQKNMQIEASSKYKSEFLANMSHELRTPLNSLLILSKDLSENKNENLTGDQVESAEIIYNSGHDLLNLINEVLDLSKIEAGKMAIHIEKINVSDIADGIYKNFRHQAEQKGLKFNVILDQNLPKTIETDSQRLDQVIKNLMSNAIKFTAKGEINFSIKNHFQGNIAIEIQDTGIGIPKEKQESIFEAFQQADGGTSRKYGGTGLGLSISRELIKLLGATLSLESETDKGTKFTLVIPVAFEQQKEETPKSTSKKYSESNEDLYATFSIPDDRGAIQDGDQVVLIIEDDLPFANILLKLAQQKGFKGIVSASGEGGLLLSEKYTPNAIIMDMNLPGITGEKLMAKLKSNPQLKHIPVHIISGEDRSQEMIGRGAVEYFMKPVEKSDLENAFERIENLINRKMKNLLVVETDEKSRKNMCKLIGSREVNCIEAATGKEALEIYKANHIDCIVIDLDLSDMSGLSLIYEFEKTKPGVMSPVIVYTSRILTKNETEELQKYTETIIIKGAKSEERLLDETALFLHKTKTSLSEPKHNTALANPFNKDDVFNGKKIILTDDDMRNIFALSKILRERGMEVLKAENGKVALEILEKNPSVNLVLMDIMMPEMDGYEAMRLIRQQPKFRNLPVIALTAKAMKEDRQKCIDAGANDYITKPVDVERLLSLIRVWLSK